MSACRARFVRRICGIPSTYGALQMGIKPVNNIQVLKKAGVDPLEVTIRELQLGYLGHVLRKSPQDP
eukprot:9059824-Alexandrium_andersonii.AAC.1